MQKTFRQYCALALLLLLSFPMVEKSLHAWEHHDEVACTITDKHFHEQEHECAICDFTITDSNGFPVCEVIFRSTSQPFYYTPVPESAALACRFSNLPARAPPAV